MSDEVQEQIGNANLHVSHWLISMKFRAFFCNFWTKPHHRRLPSTLLCLFCTTSDIHPLSLFAFRVKDYMSDWTQFRRFYNYKITTKQVRLVRRHSQVLLSPSPSVGQDQNQSLLRSPFSQYSHRRHGSDSTHSDSSPAHSMPSYSSTPWRDGKDRLREEQDRKMAMPLRSVSFSSFQSTITHDGHDCNGYSLDSSRLQKPSESEIQSVTSMMDFDDTYSRRVLGFSSTDEMYKWVSCVKLLHEIKELPIMITNALDDPLILRKCHEIPERYTSKKHRFVHPNEGCYWESTVITFSRVVPLPQ